jgi:hypothetical protein
VATQHVATSFVPGFRRSALLPTVVLENSHAKIKKGNTARAQSRFAVPPTNGGLAPPSASEIDRACAPIGESPIPRRPQNLQISSAPKFPRLQCKHFQISVVPMPSFSKDSFGGFVGFQGVAVDPNRKIDSPNFCPPNRARKAVPRPINSISCRASCMHANSRFGFPKENVCFLCKAGLGIVEATPKIVTSDRRKTFHAGRRQRNRLKLRRPPERLFRRRRVT